MKNPKSRAVGRSVRRISEANLPTTFFQGCKKYKIQVHSTLLPEAHVINDSDIWDN